MVLRAIPNLLKEFSVFRRFSRKVKTENNVNKKKTIYGIFTPRLELNYTFGFPSVKFEFCSFLRKIGVGGKTGN